MLQDTKPPASSSAGATAEPRSPPPLSSATACLLMHAARALKEGGPTDAGAPGGSEAVSENQMAVAARQKKSPQIRQTALDNLSDEDAV